MSKHPKFQIFRSEANEQYYFHLKALNGEIILASEGYTSKQNCMKGIESVKKNASAEHFEIRKALNDQHYFVLKSGNGEIIGSSETYTAITSCTKGIEAVLKTAHYAHVEDIT